MEDEDADRGLAELETQHTERRVGGVRVGGTGSPRKRRTRQEMATARSLQTADESTVIATMATGRIRKGKRKKGKRLTRREKMELELQAGTESAAHAVDTKQRMKTVAKIKSTLEDLSKFKPEWIESRFRSTPEREARIYYDIYQETKAEFLESYPDYPRLDIGLDEDIGEIVVHAFWRIHPNVNTLADLKQFAREGFDKYFQRLVEQEDHEDDVGKTI